MIRIFILMLLSLAPVAASAAPVEPAEQAAQQEAATRARLLRGDWPDHDKKITVEFDKVKVRDALRQLATEAGWGIAFEGSPTGRVDMSVHDVPADEALLSILERQHLVADRRGSMITIKPGAGEPTPGRMERVSLGDSVKVNEGEVVNSAVSIGSDVDVDGTVLGDVVSVGGRVILGPHAVVKGRAVSAGGSLEIDPMAVVDGDRVAMAASEWPLSFRQAHALRGIAGFLGALAFNYAVFFVLGLLLLTVAPTRVRAVGREMVRAPGVCAGIGFAGATAVPLLTILLVATIIGSVFIPVLAIGVVAALVLGFSSLAVELGRRVPVLRGRRSQIAALAFGCGALFVVSLVPVLGLLCLWLTSFVTFGAVLRTKFGSTREQDANFLPAAVNEGVL